MTRTIWKFKIPHGIDCFAMNMPKNAKILSLQMQDGQPCFWALIPDTSVMDEVRTFRVYGTGEIIHQGNIRYVGTFQFPPYVWHLFEETQ